MRISVAVGALVSLLASTSPSWAGQSDNDPPKCQLDSDGSGWCSGSLSAFRNSSDPLAYASFSYGASGPYFQAYINNTAGKCSVPADGGPMNDVFRVAMSTPNLSFFVYWDKTGVCRNIVANHSSRNER